MKHQFSCTGERIIFGVPDGIDWVVILGNARRDTPANRKWARSLLRGWVGDEVPPIGRLKQAHMCPDATDKGMWHFCLPHHPAACRGTIVYWEREK